MSEITLDNRSFSLLEYIYNNPYISYASLKVTFPSYNDIEDLVLSFDEQHLISLTITVEAMDTRPGTITSQ